MWHRGFPFVEHHGSEEVTVHRLRDSRTALPALVRDTRQRYAPPYPDPVLMRQIRSVTRRQRPDVVLSHGWLSYSVVAALRRTGIPIALSAHDYGYFCTTRRLLWDGKTCSGPAPLKCLTCSMDYYGRSKGAVAAPAVLMGRRMLAQNVEGVHSVTAFVGDLMERYLLRGAGVSRSIRRFTIPAFVPQADHLSVRDRRAIVELEEKLPREPFIFFVGAFRADKGIQALIDAHATLEPRPPLVMMGTLERDTPPIPDYVTVIYDVPHAAVRAAWKRALIGVVPSLLPEPLGTVSVEGITYGVPTIATVPSGMADVLAEDSGILIPQGDVPALADAMRSLIASPELRERLIRNGLRRSRQFAEDVVLDRYEEMLKELTDAGAPSA
jgi:glycosyltransferase involved in cell wall biosynthesis